MNHGFQIFFQIIGPKPAGLAFRPRILEADNLSKDPLSPWIPFFFSCLENGIRILHSIPQRMQNPRFSRVIAARPFGLPHRQHILLGIKALLCVLYLGSGKLQKLVSHPHPLCFLNSHNDSFLRPCFSDGSLFFQAGNGHGRCLFPNSLPWPSLFAHFLSYFAKNASTCSCSCAVASATPALFILSTKSL